LVTGLCQMLAPVLTFTADEAWDAISGPKTDSVHQSIWNPTLFSNTPEEIFNWKRLFTFRVSALPGLEALRQNKFIGKSLEAKISAMGDQETLNPVIKLQNDFQELLGISQFTFEIGGEPGKAGITFGYSHVDSNRQKCERCWHWETDIGQNSAHPTICGRCTKAVLELQAKSH
jgi:isoleucyl-tRNA synthetase